MDPRSLIVIGSGPAGYTAAIYAARAGLQPLVIASSVEAGGALVNTTEVENFPGFPDGIMGPDLMDNMRRQAEKFGAELVYDDATGVDLAKAVKCVRLGSGQEYGAKAVVLATGSAYRHLGVEGEERLTGHGLSYCATCDGAFFRDKVIYVIGGGDSALTEALFLTRFGRTVTVVHRRDQLRASRVLQERAAAQPNLDFAWNSTVSRVIGETAVTALELTDTVNGATREVPADGVFVAIGHEPRTTFLDGQVELDDHGYIVVDGRSSRTSLPGVFACGDAVDHTYRQAITAAAAGCRAALDAQDYLGRLDADAQVAGGTV